MCRQDCGGESMVEGGASRRRGIGAEVGWGMEGEWVFTQGLNVEKKITQQLDRIGSMYFVPQRRKESCTDRNCIVKYICSSTTDYTTCTSD